MGIAERKEREKQQRREAIVQAAEKVFFDQGFDQSTMDDIAGEAELSKGTLYLYFKSKEDLHMAVARRGIHLLRERTSAAADKGGNALEILWRIGRTCVDFSRSHPDHMRSIMTLEELDAEEVSLTGSDLKELLYRESTVGTVLQVVEQGMKEKLIRQDLPSLLVAHTLWMSVLSVIRFVSREVPLLGVLDLTSDQLYESHFELVINGIRS